MKSKIIFRLFILLSVAVSAITGMWMAKDGEFSASLMCNIISFLFGLWLGVSLEIDERRNKRNTK